MTTRPVDADDPYRDDDTDVAAIHFSSTVGQNMKGLIYANNEVFAWDIDPGSGMPEHDTISMIRFPCADSIVRLTHMIIDGIPCCHIDCDCSPFGEVAHGAVRAFSAVRKQTELQIDSGYAILRMPFEDYWTYYRLAPDPDDFDDGEMDVEYREELNELINAITTQKTYRQLLGRGGPSDVYEGFSVYGNPRRK
jgi:hypothetical protein